jgi:hypothetical protein
LATAFHSFELARALEVTLSHAGVISLSSGFAGWAEKLKGMMG